MTAEERAELEAAEADRRRRAAELPAAERERLRARAAELGTGETIEERLQRLRDNPPPGRPEADEAGLVARSAWRSPPATSAAEPTEAEPPPTVEPETRADRRIVPALKVTGPSPERERGVLFGGLVEDRPRTADLTLFPHLEPDRPRVPLLEVVDAAGVPVRSRGRGAPIEARLLVRGGLLMIRPEDRRRAVVRIAVTVGELLDGLYPTAGRQRDRRRIAENWPKIEAALHKARDFTVPDATGGRWFPMALRRLPTPEGVMPAADDVVVLDLAPPPGASTGPSVDLPALDDMGATSGPKWRAYIAGRSLIWLPGKTRRPVPNEDWYGWSADPNDYPVLTLADLRRLAFGDMDAKHRTKAAIVAPWANLPDLVALSDQLDVRTGIRGFRLLPAEAAEPLRKLIDEADATGESGRNRGV